MNKNVAATIIISCIRVTLISSLCYIVRYYDPEIKDEADGEHAEIPRAATPHIEITHADDEAFVKTPTIPDNDVEMEVEEDVIQ